MQSENYNLNQECIKIAQATILNCTKNSVYGKSV